MNRLFAALASLLAAPLAAAPFVYVSNEGSASVSVIDLATGAVTATITTGSKPRGIEVALDGARVFVSEQAGNAVAAYDARTGREIARTPVGKSPEAVYLSPDGKWLA